MIELFSVMQEYVKQILIDPGSHGFDHTIRVTCLCELIGESENADMNILIPAALFHDIARPLEKSSGISHEEEGARIAGKYLNDNHYPEKFIPPIMHAIRTHRFRSTMLPETLEAKILSDADKLDAMGAVGIARTFISAGERKGDIEDAMNHFEEKIVKLSDMMYTKSGQMIALKRHEFLVTFIQKIREEMSDSYQQTSHF